MGDIFLNSFFGKRGHGEKFSSAQHHLLFK
ncbi:hypothetical protein FUSO4_05915 [Fusobacterium necrophorum DJ-1]|uniref:Uncharacterized protein n=3 Tax=Fusobacterium necrophorum TaxID=859 RepID=A0A0B4EQK2_9FUSO|nr:hypothetical protein FUSO3_05765 [Fusobacterium necrophorum BL]KDE63673.1 hypothetical protein FUSO5_07560 [Fusobacterium necrophorum BFTR-1]KDE65766.1 hypothetical protein FUSO4_05915 [Fusobacterium necrophorum DJ-1]KDE73162.1 hypothetical protein FUSO7_07195 [Fusobacterium necrophorum BFTR-2]KDE73587.1 hypothetical protein FUSO8_00795 [Fusobacterium necrophorum DJ-2]KID49250.1 hypothetical protein C095_05890 [Fusobacterium necrophorum subsp. funduliforme B35]